MEAAVYSNMREAVDTSLELAERQNRFVSEHLRRIFIQIYRIVGNVADAQDLTQEAFIKALQRQDQLKDELKAAHWLSRIATNTAIDFLRRNGRVSFCEIDAAPEAPSESPEDLLLRQRAPGLFGGWAAAALTKRAGRADDEGRGRPAGGRSRQAAGLLQGHRSFPYRQCPDEIPAVHGEEEAVRR